MTFKISCIKKEEKRKEEKEHKAITTIIISIKTIEKNFKKEAM